MSRVMQASRLRIRPTAPPRELFMNTANTFFARFVVRASSFVVLCASLAVVGYASSESDEVASAGAALSSCPPANYEAALAHYKNAVAWSNDRLEHGACETENG